MDNKEEILDALEEFSRRPSTSIPCLLEEYLQHVAKTGETWFPWNKLRQLIIHKMDSVILEFQRQYPMDDQATGPNVDNIRFTDMRQCVLGTLEAIGGVPFTIQRICELMTNPRCHYRRTDKFLRGVHKTVKVVTTVDPFGRKIVRDSPPPLVNGIDPNGYGDVINPASLSPGPGSPPPNTPANSPAVRQEGTRLQQRATTAGMPVGSGEVKHEFNLVASGNKLDNYSINMSGATQEHADVSEHSDPIDDHTLHVSDAYAFDRRSSEGSTADDDSSRSVSLVSDESSAKTDSELIDQPRKLVETSRLPIFTKRDSEGSTADDDSSRSVSLVSDQSSRTDSELIDQAGKDVETSRLPKFTQRNSEGSTADDDSSRSVSLVSDQSSARSDSEILTVATKGEAMGHFPKQDKIPEGDFLDGILAPEMLDVRVLADSTSAQGTSEVVSSRNEDWTGLVSEHRESIDSLKTRSSSIEEQDDAYFHKLEKLKTAEMLDNNLYSLRTPTSSSHLLGETSLPLLHKDHFESRDNQNNSAETTCIDLQISSSDSVGIDAAAADCLDTLPLPFACSTVPSQTLQSNLLSKADETVTTATESNNCSEESRLVPDSSSELVSEEMEIQPSASEFGTSDAADERTVLQGADEEKEADSTEDDDISERRNSDGFEPADEENIEMVDSSGCLLADREADEKMDVQDSS